MGNDVHMLIVSSGVLGAKTTMNGINKPIIYVIARQHAGETPGSFVVEGMINFLLSTRP